MFVDLQIEIHGYLPLLNRQRDKYARMIDSLDQLNATTRYNLQERLDGMTKEFKVCHGDFNPPTSSSATTASSMCATGHTPPRSSPAADVATTYLLFALNSKRPSRGLPRALLRPRRHAHAGRASVDEHRCRFRARS